jgi:hypothetical protein
MGFARLLIILAIVGFAIQWWKGRDADSGTATTALSGEASPNGFVPAAMPDGVPPDTVVILAPLNCPSDGAQRANSLAGELEGRRIRVIRTSRYSARGDAANPDRRASLDQAVAVLNGEIPAVFVNGMAKSNPSADEVVAEYRRTR